jgi:hypothetical protein
MCFVNVDLPLPALPVTQYIPWPLSSHDIYVTEGEEDVFVSKIQLYEEWPGSGIVSWRILMSEYRRLDSMLSCGSSSVAAHRAANSFFVSSALCEAVMFTISATTSVFSWVSCRDAEE